MAGSYAYTPAIWPPLAGAFLLTGIGLYSWRRRDVPAALPLLAVSTFGILWLLGIALEVTAVDPAAKIAWFRFQSLWRAPAVTAGLCFVLEYAYPGRWLTRRNLLLLSLPALLDVLLIVTNNSRLMWRELPIGPDGSVAAVLAPGGLIMSVYGVGLVVVNTVVLLWLFIRSPQHRWPVVLILVGQISNRALYAVDAANLSWLAPIDAAVLGTLLLSAMYALALFAFHIFDPVPAARIAALEQMRDGILVFDPQWQLASLNHASVTALGVSALNAQGKRPAEIVPAFGSLVLASEAGPPGPFEVTLGTGGGARSYEAHISQLRDFRGLLLGYLILLSDVTEHKRTQAQIVAQQRSLAMLREREQLARELHDGIAQVLGFASLKMGATRKLIADGKLARADDLLAHLESAVAEAHADLRETILNLRSAPTGEKPFFVALQHYVDGYRQNYGIQVDLAIGDGVDESSLTPEAQMQLFRVLQEAFSNARKHAQTDCVRASFELQGSLLCVRIQDDGIGFDPASQVVGAGASHLGLRFMRERVEQLGGSLRVDSAPGAGTCVELSVPAKADAEPSPPGCGAIGDERCAC
jgi:signal transduction histidine kinase